MNKIKKIIIATGGTGGHVIPAYCLAKHFKAKNIGVEITSDERGIKYLKENKEIKIIPEMLNLLGCSKDNFKKLLQKMNYKIFDKDDETYFKYNPIKKFKKETIKKVSNENPFKILKNLNFKFKRVNKSIKETSIQFLKQQD